MPDKYFEPNPQDTWDEEYHPTPVPEADVLDDIPNPKYLEGLVQNIYLAQ